MPNEFIFCNTDYVDFIKSEEDLKLFNRMKELFPRFEKRIQDDVNAFKECVQIDRKLRGLEPIKFYDLNPNADLLN
jgi:hypothetical protein